LPGNARQLENLVRWVLGNKDDDTPLNRGDLPLQVWEQLSGLTAATGEKFTVRRSDVHSMYENRYLAVFQTAGKNG
jgi:hypothetical protein